MKRLLISVAILGTVALTLIHFQNPQLVVYSFTISRESLVDSPLFVQNIGAGLLAIDSADGTGFSGGPNSVFLMPQECRMIVVIRRSFVLFPCQRRPPRLRGWRSAGIRISLDGLSWMRTL